MAKPKLYWPFWVGTGWTAIYVLYAAIQWFRGVPKPSEWFLWMYFAPVILCMWIQSIWNSGRDVEYEEKQLRWEVKRAVDEAMKPHKIARVVETEAETVGDE